jgi:hypothetical protein
MYYYILISLQRATIFKLRDSQAVAR